MNKGGEINVGDRAPDFQLKRDGGSEISLASLKGQWVILYFYPKDNTPGCTKQAIGFTEMSEIFNDHGAVIVGISPDSTASHDKFKAKHDLNIILAADEERQAITAYDVWKEKNMYGRRYKGVERSTFLVDRDGIIKALWRKVKIPGHIEAVLEKIKELEN